MDTIFTKIEKGEIPSVKIYEDELCFAILDINPVEKGHALVISRQVFPNTGSCPDNILCHMIAVAAKIERKQHNVLNTDGSNILINNNKASGQEIAHLHIHIIPRYNNDGKNFVTSHEKYSDGEICSFGEKLTIEK